jgi:hypothetical protein
MRPGAPLTRSEGAIASRTSTGNRSSGPGCAWTAVAAASAAGTSSVRKNLLICGLLRLEGRNLPDSTELLWPFGPVDDDPGAGGPGAWRLAVEREVQQNLSNDLRCGFDEQQLACHDDVIETRRQTRQIGNDG